LLTSVREPAGTLCYSAAVPQYEIAISDGQSVSRSEEHPTIEIARDATIRAALEAMLETPFHRNPRTASCSVVEQDSLEERSFSVTLTITDMV